MNDYRDDYKDDYGDDHGDDRRGSHGEEYSDGPGDSRYAGDPALTPEEKQMAMLCHLSSFALYVVPFGNIIGPLVVWLMKKEESEYVNEHGKECLNFSLSWWIWMFCCIPLAFIVVGVLGFIALPIMHIVCTIIAAVRSNDGQDYRYPMTIRFIK